MMPPIEVDRRPGTPEGERAASGWAGSWVSVRQTRRLSRVSRFTKKGLSSRLISRNVGFSKNTVMEIVKLEFRAAKTYAQERLW